MTDAERQARYRAARAAGAPVIRTRRPADHRSRARRWHDAVAELPRCRSVCRLARSAAGQPAGQRARRGVAGDLRSRSHRTAGDRPAARLRPRLTRATSALRTVIPNALRMGPSSADSGSLSRRLTPILAISSKPRTISAQKAAPANNSSSLRNRARPGCATPTSSAVASAAARPRPQHGSVLDADRGSKLRAD